MLDIKRIYTAFVIGCILFSYSIQPLSENHVHAQIVDKNFPYSPHNPIIINSSSDFTLANGVTEGDGTKDNPWRIENLTINCTGYDYGILIFYTNDYVIINNCHLFSESETQYEDRYGINYRIGIFIGLVANVRIENTTIEDKFHSGIKIDVSENIKVANNIVSGQQIGLSMSASSTVLISNNTFTLNDAEDVMINNCEDIMFASNNLSSGILIYASLIRYSNNLNIDTTNKINGKTVYYLKNLERSFIPSNAGQVILANCREISVSNLNLTGKYGVQLLFSNNNIIKSNTLSHMEFALLIKNSNNNTIYGNIFNNNTRGISLSESSNNTFYRNFFINNTRHAFDIGANHWDNGSEGNYWDDYTGADENNDGIGDMPYSIWGGVNMDRYPIVQPVDDEIVKPEKQTGFWLMLIALAAIIAGVVFILAYTRRKRTEKKEGYVTSGIPRNMNGEIEGTNTSDDKATIGEQHE